MQQPSPWFETYATPVDVDLRPLAPSTGMFFGDYQPKVDVVAIRCQGGGVLNVKRHDLAVVPLYFAAGETLDVRVTGLVAAGSTVTGITVFWGPRYF